MSRYTPDQIARQRLIGLTVVLLFLVAVSL